MIHRSEEIAVIIRQIWSMGYFDRDELRSLHHHCPRLFIDADIDPKSLIGRLMRRLHSTYLPSLAERSQTEALGDIYGRRTARHGILGFASLALALNKS